MGYEKEKKEKWCKYSPVCSFSVDWMGLAWLWVGYELPYLRSLSCVYIFCRDWLTMLVSSSSSYHGEAKTEALNVPSDFRGGF